MPKRADLLLNGKWIYHERQVSAAAQCCCECHVLEGAEILKMLIMVSLD